MSSKCRICLALIDMLLMTVWWRCSWNPWCCPIYLTVHVWQFGVHHLETLYYRNFKECRIMQWGCVVINENITMCLHSITDTGCHCHVSFNCVQCTISTINLNVFHWNDLSILAELIIQEHLYILLYNISMFCLRFTPFCFKATQWWNSLLFTVTIVLVIQFMSTWMPLHSIVTHCIVFYYDCTCSYILCITMLSCNYIIFVFCITLLVVMCVILYVCVHC